MVDDDVMVVDDVIILLLRYYPLERSMQVPDDPNPNPDKCMCISSVYNLEWL